MMEGSQEDDTEVVLDNPGINMNEPITMPKLPRQLTHEEKKYLLAVERGDMANVRR